MTSTRVSFALYLLFVLATSFFTYFYRYNVPSQPFWDEPYHISAAQKYLHGVYFMEQHPPLGKLLIALGEKLTHANAKTDQFIETEYAKDFDTKIEGSSATQHTSFTGYRLFPALMGWLTSVIIFLLFFAITKNPAVSALLSFLYIFDNGLIVHSRGAMVDTPLTFFGMLTLLIFIHIVQHKSTDIFRHILLSFFFGLAFALAFTTKLVALILIILFPIACVLLFPHWRNIVLFIVASGVGFLLAYSAVWQTHFALGSKIVPALPDQGYFQASPEYKKILTEKKNGLWSSFPVMLRDSINYVGFYSKGVPRLDLCKSEENGSPAYFWPLGGRTINYRWEKQDHWENIKDYKTRYLYLVPNPVSWGLGLIGVILSVILVVSSFVTEQKKKTVHLKLMIVLLCLYFGYMIAILQLSRVMYLYHYFLPLLFSYILFGLSFTSLERVGPLVLTAHRKTLILTLISLCVFFGYQFYRPLTYYEFISDKSFQARSILPIWELSCVNCTKVNSLAIPPSQD